MKKGISVVLIVRNEELNLDACLKSCSFADELIVVNDGSTDRTVEIAESYGAKVFHRALNGDWAAQQNYGIDQATQYWVFLLDADERVTPDLAKKLLECAAGEDKAYWVQRHNRFKHICAEHGTMRPDWVCRLMPRTKVRIYGQVHPEIRVQCPPERIHGDGMIHYPYRTWRQYMNKINTYSELSAEKYLSEGRNVVFWRDVMLRPIWSFIKIYFINRGFLDGKAGFVFSINNSVYTMMKYVKYYFLKHYSGEL
ncbi:glycosyltransferase family 2 protein [Sutterella sp.]|uniref:glycosyltransferase family 2 protein n=1 Tax=Sutterella sp. TaxID=1981025 RepID=UPI003FD8416A